MVQGFWKIVYQIFGKYTLAISSCRTCPHHFPGWASDGQNKQLTDTMGGGCCLCLQGEE